MWANENNFTLDGAKTVGYLLDKWNFILVQMKRSVTRLDSGTMSPAPRAQTTKKDFHFNVGIIHSDTQKRKAAFYNIEFIIWQL